MNQEESPELSPVRPIEVKGVSGAWAKKSNATFDLEADFVPLGGASPPLPGASNGSFWDSMKKTSNAENKTHVNNAALSPAACETNGKKLFCEIDLYSYRFSSTTNAYSWRRVCKSS